MMSGATGSRVDGELPVSQPAPSSAAPATGARPRLAPTAAGRSAAPARHAPRRGGAGAAFALACAAGVCAGLAGLASPVRAQDAGQNDGPPPTVAVMPVTAEDVSRSAEYVGRVQSIQSVDLVARVEGFLESVNFAEGSAVASGETLFEIEKAQYQAQLAAAQGQLAAAQAQLTGAKAQLNNAEITLQRQLTLVQRGTVSQATADNAQASRDIAAADVQQAEAAVQQAKAEIQTATLNLSYTDVLAPIDGRIGAVSVTQGNLVSRQTGTLATIVQIDPIRIAFSIPESLFVDLMEERQRATGTPASPTSADSDATDGAQTAADSSGAAAGPAGNSGTASASPSSGGASPSPDSVAAATAAGSADDTSGASTGSGGPGAADAATDSAATSGNADGASGDASAAASASAGAGAPASDNTAASSSASATAGAPAAGAAPAGTNGSATPGDVVARGPVDPRTMVAAAPTGGAVPNPNANPAAGDFFEPHLVLANGKTYDEDGSISFAGNQISATTGTLVLYADFPNPDGVLLPGGFVTVRVAEAMHKRTPVVPAAAILQDREGQYVFVVDAQNRVQQRRIKTGQKVADGIPVMSGLAEGETIIVEGLQKVRPGIVVTPKLYSPPSASGGASTAASPAAPASAGAAAGASQ